MSNIESDVKNTLIQQCNYWFSEFKKLEKHKSINNNKNLMIEALGCAKGNLCILKELDKENISIYDNFIHDINCKLEEIYDDKLNFQLKSNSLLYNKATSNKILH